MSLPAHWEVAKSRSLHVLPDKALQLLAIDNTVYYALGLVLETKAGSEATVHVSVSNAAETCG